MSQTMRHIDPASHREQLADARPRPAKAELRAQVHASRLRDVAADAIRTVSGNARAAAIDLNIHEAHLSRLLKDGSIRLEQLEVLGPSFAVEFAESLLEKFGALATPKDRAREAIKRAEDALDEIKQFVDVA